MLNELFLPRQNRGRIIFPAFRGSYLVRSFFLLCVAAGVLAAQDSTPTSNGSVSDSTRGITAATQFFDHDFVNLFVYGDGVWDSHVPVVGGGSYKNGLGWDAGGGLTATHTFHDGSLSINYRGGYSQDRTLGFSGGQQQSLSFAFEKRLNRRWTLGASVSGAILSYGTSFYSGTSVASITPGNPLSPESRFANAGLSLSYAQTRRLSYVFSGNFLVNSFNLAGAYSTHGFSGAASVYYRLTARTTVGGTYSHSYFAYTGNGGTTNVDSGSLTLSHIFPEHWQIDLSAGVNRAHSVGTVQVPVAFSFNGQVITGYYTGPYNRTIYSPVFQGVISHSFRRSSASLSGGQGVMSGNGLYLTSRDQFVNGTFSFSNRHSNASFGGNYVRMSSIANSISQVYSYYGFSAGYGINLIRYVSANARYDLIHYDRLLSLTQNTTESRITFGISLSTKSVPLTLF